jgi:hypothetical protein
VQPEDALATAWIALILHYATSDARSEHPRLNEEVSLEID